MLDNLSIHLVAAPYQAFRRMKRAGCCAAWSSTNIPKHASWLNMVEIGVLSRALSSLPPRINGAITSLARVRMNAHNRKGSRQNGRAYPKPIAKQPNFNESKPLCRGTTLFDLVAAPATREWFISSRASGPDARP